MSVERPSDTDLVARVALARDPGALAELYDRYASVAYGFSLRFASDADTAEDLVQEAFFNVWRRASAYTQDKGSVPSWILSMVHHQAVDKLHRSRYSQALIACLLHGPLGTVKGGLRLAAAKLRTLLADPLAA